MPSALTGAAQFLTKFSTQSVTCNRYALTKLGVDSGHCYLKIEEYMILCVPFQLGFKRSLFIAALNKQELAFFKRYLNSIIGLSITFTPSRRQDPIKFFIRCTLTTVGQMKGRENVGLFVVDYKNTPDELVVLLGEYLENEGRMKTLYGEYAKPIIKMTADTAKIIGYNMFAAITEPGVKEKRIQIFALSTKTIDHLEPQPSEPRPPGRSVGYQLFFKKYRFHVSGEVNAAVRLPQGIVRTSSSLLFSPELVEIIDDYWYTIRANPVLRAAQ
jgi:hypothetical protein